VKLSRALFLWPLLILYSGELYYHLDVFYLCLNCFFFLLVSCYSTELYFDVLPVYISWTWSDAWPCLIVQEMLLLLLPLLNSSSVKKFLLAFSKDKSAGSSGDEADCPICRSSPSIPFIALPCQHRYAVSFCAPPVIYLPLWYTPFVDSILHFAEQRSTLEKPCSYSPYRLRARLVPKWSLALPCSARKRLDCMWDYLEVCASKDFPCSRGRASLARLHWKNLPCWARWGEQNQQENQTFPNIWDGVYYSSSL